MRIGWLDTPPYLTDQENQDGGGSNASDLKGIIMDLTAKGLEVCCRNNVTSVYEKKFHDIAEMVEASVNSSLDLVLPVRLSVGKEMFIAFPFIGLGKSIYLFQFVLVNSSYDWPGYRSHIFFDSLSSKHI